MRYLDQLLLVIVVTVVAVAAVDDVLVVDVRIDYVATCDGREAHAHLALTS